jgi:hypothetical protein
MMLASMQYNGGNHDAGVATLRKRIADAPAPDAYKLLAAWTEGAARLEAWREGWQKFGKTDREFALYFGETLLGTGQYHEAASVLGSQVQEQAKSSRFQWDLGRALLGDSQRAAGIAALRRAAELDPRPLILNNVAYELADRSVALDDALALAIRGVKGVEEETSHLTLEKVDATALGTIPSLGAYWDTLAWAHFKLGHLDEAERYGLAAWELMGEETYAKHLSEIYKAKNKPAEATFYSEIATIARNSDSAALSALIEKDVNKTAARKLRDAMVLMVPRQPNAAGTAQAYVLAGSDGTITSVSFIQGDAALRPQVEALRGLKLRLEIPAGSTASLLRRGALQCRPELSECQFTLVQARAAASMR